MGDSDTPDIADIYGDFSVVATPLASVSVSTASVSGVNVVSDVDASISVSTGARREIRNPS